MIGSLLRITVTASVNRCRKRKGNTGIKSKRLASFPIQGNQTLCPGPENIAFFKRFMRDFMSLYKYNKVIIEFNCMRLDKHPEVNAGWIEFSKYMQYSRSNSTEGIQGRRKKFKSF